MSAILRELNSDIIRLNQVLKINNFIPDGILELIQKHVPDNNFILGVKYMSSESQILISGHPKEGESIQEGALREMTEELMLASKNNKLNYSHSVKNNHFYHISMKDTYISKIVNYSRIKDLPDRAIICVYGNEFEILRYMSKIKKRERNKDMIDGIWAAKKSKIISIIKLMQITKKRARIY